MYTLLRSGPAVQVAWLMCVGRSRLADKRDCREQRVGEHEAGQHIGGK